LTRSFGVGFHKLFRKKEIIEELTSLFLDYCKNSGEVLVTTALLFEQIENTDWEPKWVNKESSKASGK
jgi:phenylpyruvate tautomerase PptA (4-oxalocrotonate tautomerase family)